jgi:transcriptional repressor NrdR
MRCPFCGHIEDKVVDSREARDGDSIRRRRECLECGRRFTSYERIDEIPYMVVKKDGRRNRSSETRSLREFSERARNGLSPATNWMRSPMK